MSVKLLLQPIMKYTPETTKWTFKTQKQLGLSGADSSPRPYQLDTCPGPTGMPLAHHTQSRTHCSGWRALLPQRGKGLSGSRLTSAWGVEGRGPLEEL